ncbi:hypothetical protein FSARC_14512 [Fusarium sarcochroum]|uniref:Phosphoribosyltransferase domain-containing protein n=1 Tax=Fusarium sarcochroum TaxID=1208366 RepID=A0A8H4STA8_9HYPO|nr:hypothetical protein FSARC_14512 [Fusarium sarcochroum]
MGLLSWGFGISPYLLAGKTSSDTNDPEPSGLPSGVNVHTGKEIETAPKPTVIGIYGVDFIFFEGSEVIASLVPGGLDAFRQLDEAQKADWRGQAIETIRNKSASSGKAVYTSKDLQTFTHIIYLSFPVNIISQRSSDDVQKVRKVLSVEDLRKWQEAEITTMRNLCRQHQILFSLVSETKTVVPRVRDLIQYLRQSTTSETNMARVKARLTDILTLRGYADWEIVLVMDGDKTLMEEDTGALFWKAFSRTPSNLDTTCPPRELFGGPMDYSDAAFHQATLLYEESADDKHFETICETVASSVAVYPEVVSLLRLAATQKHVGALVVTCGLGRVWRKVLERHGLSESVDVIGGGRISDGFVITPAAKTSIVSHLRNDAHLYVWASGDSPLDIPMLREADQAIVVVGDESTRSLSMDTALSRAIDDGLQARQVLLPSQSPLRLDKDRLPLASLDDQQFIDSILHRRPFEVLHATEKPAAKLLMSSMRDAAVAGPALRDAHQQVGWYLATEYVAQLIGLEKYTIPHAQGHSTTGHRLLNEHKTSIVAMMRGGEPMAFGINAAFPKARFIHASSAEDIKTHHVENQSTVILVDSVVNSGKSTIEFITHVGHLQPNIRLVVVAGVVQAEAVDEGHTLAKVMRRYGASIVALRLPENKFTGTKTTDTGNRLFNTTYLV